MAKRLLQWHPAFCAALRIELEEEADKIRIEEEHLLGEKPMQIDLLIIKKDKTPYQAVMDVIMRANDEKMEDEEMVPHEVWVEAARKAIEKHNMEIGEEKMGQLAEKLIANGRISDVSKATKDGVFRQKMYEEFGIGRNA